MKKLLAAAAIAAAFLSGSVLAAETLSDMSTAQQQTITSTVKDSVSHTMQNAKKDMHKTRTSSQKTWHETKKHVAKVGHKTHKTVTRMKKDITGAVSK